jgi:hypothetical protein
MAKKSQKLPVADDNLGVACRVGGSVVGYVGAVPDL